MKKELTLYMADYISCQPDWHWNSDSNNWIGYHIWHVEKGGAEILVSNEKYTLYPGDFFLFDLKENHVCTHNPDNPLMVSTVYFDCPDFTLSKRLIRQNTLLNQAVQQIYTCMKNGQKDLALLWLHAIWETFIKYQPELPPIAPAVSCACAYIEEHLADNFSLRQLCDYVGYSENQLIRLFRRDLNCTPLQYCLKRKIASAKNQLIYSSQSVREISDILGFYDSSHFSKIFKEQVGCTPKEFRQLPVGSVI